MRSPLQLAAAGSLLICVCTAQLTTYDVNFEDVPEGTQVDSTLVTPSSNVCSCNLTLQACDTNCCCDPDCSDELKALFSSCDTQASNVPELNYCMDTSELVEVSSPRRSPELLSMSCTASLARAGFQPICTVRRKRRG
jgi:hypothetical protein